ncbi:triphosphoribosyl-dephospho-CoA synthase [Streptomyces hydrogenans]|uniref:triphosphoribosyl-dephospho-CoA synthase n=1 Tax=Streptomyces hydrogenans TaxID=1873719 RepID=UPI0035D6BEE5
MLSPPLSAGPAAPADGTRDGEDPALADQAMAVLVEVAGLAPWRREGEAEVRAHARRLRRLFLRASSAGREGPGLLEQVRREGARPPAAHGAAGDLHETFWALAVLLAAGPGPSRSPEDVCRDADDLDALLRPPSRGGKTGTSSFALAAAVGLPALRAGRAAGRGESVARLDALLALVAETGDTRVHREHGVLAVRMLRQDARTVLAAGGSGTREGHRLLADMERSIAFYGTRPTAGTAALATALLLERTTSPDGGGTP